MKMKGSAVALFTILVLAAATGNLSQTSLNTMLNTVAGDFGIGVDVGQWLTNIYILVLGVAVPLTTYLTRKMQMRTFVVLTLVLFVVGALVDFVANSFAMLMVGRVLQAISTGFSMPVMQNVAMMRFPRHRQGMAIGIAGIAMGFAPNIGPTVGSLFAQTVGWRAFFLLLAGIPLVLLLLALLLVPKEPQQDARGVRLDLGSFALSALAFGGLLASASDASSLGFSSPATWIPLVVGAVCLVVFLRRQKRTDNPLIDLAIFRVRNYATGFWMQTLLFGSFIGVTLVIPLYVQGLQGGTPLESGMVLLPGAITALIFNPLGGMLGDKLGKEKVVLMGAVIYAVGSLLALLFDAGTPLWLAALCQAIRGVGISTSMSSTVAWMLQDLPRPLVGHGSSFTVLVRQAAASMGTALMVLMVTELGMVFGGTIVPYRVAFAFSAILGVAMLVIALVRVKVPRS